MNRNYIIIFSVIGILALGAVGIFLLQVKNLPNNNPQPVSPAGSTNPSPAPQPVPPQPVHPPYVPKDGAVQPVLPLEKQADFVIDITTAGFSPDKLTVKKGDSIIWTSRDRYNSHEILSTGSKTYAGMDSPVLKLGDSWRVTFNTVGTFTYVDKLNSKFTGTIIVQ